MFAAVSEVLSDCTAGVRGQELQWRRVRSSCSHHDGVGHCACLVEYLDHVGHGGPLLADCDLDAVQLLALVVAVEVQLLVDNGVNGNGGFAGLSVADDQLTLATAHWHERVDCLQAGLHRLID